MRQVTPFNIVQVHRRIKKKKLMKNEELKRRN